VEEALMEKYYSKMDNSQKLHYLMLKYDFDINITSDIHKRLGDFALSCPSDEDMEAYVKQQVRYLENILKFGKMKFGKMKRSVSND